MGDDFLGHDIRQSMVGSRLNSMINKLQLTSPSKDPMLGNHNNMEVHDVNELVSLDSSRSSVAAERNDNSEDEIEVEQI